MKTPQLIDLPRVGDVTARQLVEHGLRTVEEVAAASIEKIRAVPGFGVSRASAVRQAAMRLLGEVTAVAPVPKSDEKPKKKGGESMAKKKDDEKSKKKDDKKSKKKDDKKSKKKDDKKSKKKKGDKKSKKKDSKKKKSKK